MVDETEALRALFRLEEAHRAMNDELCGARRFLRSLRRRPMNPADVEMEVRLDVRVTHLLAQMNASALQLEAARALVRSSRPRPPQPPRPPHAVSRPSRRSLPN